MMKVVSGQNQAFALEGINKNVKVEWKVPNIQPQHILDYQHSKNDVQFEIKDLIQIIKRQSIESIKMNVII